MLKFSICLIATISSMLLVELFVRPRAAHFRVFHRMSLLSVMPAIVFYMTLFMISYRPLFAMGGTLLAFSAIVTVNNAKFAALKEPLVFSDFALLREAVQHPTLYVRYIGRFNILAVLGTAILGIVATIAYERPIIQRTTAADFFPTAAYLFVTLGTIYSITRGPFRGTFVQLLARFGPEADVRKDIDKLSLVVCLIFYFLLANEVAHRPSREKAPPARRPPPVWPRDPSKLPHAVVVQSESFFDARRVHPSIPSDLLRRWDALGAEAAYRGRLLVPAWGANTMRTEFAFLSGLPNDALGVHRFNPYLNLCSAPVWTVAHQLRSMGYRTICVHPYSGSFFKRDEVFPNLGFDTFLDIEAFDGAARFGPYVSDLAVADKIIDLLGDDPAPKFVFAITMENHGKWERGRLDGEPARPQDPPPMQLGSYELGAYLRHLANADEMVGRLADALREAPGDAVLCMFGDHVPSLPSVFGKTGFLDPRTDYLVWRKSGRHPRTLNVAADGLGRLVLDAVLNEANHAAILQPASRAH